MANGDKDNCPCMNEENEQIMVEAQQTIVPSMNNKENLLSNIQSTEFAITELTLYLDTHPNDYKALCLHKKYCNEAEKMKNVYQRTYGPLTSNCPCNKWRWIEEPWPWEGGEG